MNIVKRCFLMVVAILLYTASFAQNKPNFVFILTYDHRYDVLGCTGNEIVKTPNIDRLVNAERYLPMRM